MIIFIQVEIAYLWKVLGYKIGIEDRFNLLNDLDYDLIYTMCKLILEQDYLPFIENASSPMGNLFLMNKYESIFE